MQDFLVTIVIAWILFRLFRPVVFIQWNKPQKHYHNYYSGPQSSGNNEIKVTRPPQQNKESNNSGEDGEYIDFEDIPK